MRSCGYRIIAPDVFTANPTGCLGRRKYGEAIEFQRRFDVRIPATFSWPRMWDVLVESVRACAAIAKGAGLRLAMEPRVGETISTTDAPLRLMDPVGDDACGAVLDTGHLRAQEEILALSVEKLRGRVFYAHASDNDGRNNGPLAPGRRSIDWTSVFHGLARHGFGGWVGIDVGGADDLETQYREGYTFVCGELNRLAVPPNLPQS